MNFLQYLLPRRKENVLNFILLMILVGLFIYFYPYNTFHYQMPPQEVRFFFSINFAYNLSFPTSNLSA